MQTGVYMLCEEIGAKAYFYRFLEELKQWKITLMSYNSTNTQHKEY